ncbi:MAG TPA: DUF1631 family protein, partial [Lysobacter sp.]
MRAIGQRTPGRAANADRNAIGRLLESPLARGEPMTAPPEPNIFLKGQGALAAAALPRRVREALQDLHAVVDARVVAALDGVLDALERQLFERAERAATPAVQVRHLAQMRAVQRNRDRLGPRFLELIEADLAELRRPAH